MSVFNRMFKRIFIQECYVFTLNCGPSRLELIPPAVQNQLWSGVGSDRKWLGRGWGPCLWHVWSQNVCCCHLCWTGSSFHRCPCNYRCSDTTRRYRALYQRILKKSNYLCFNSCILLIWCRCDITVIKVQPLCNNRKTRSTVEENARI